MHNLKIENCVLFGQLTEDFSPGGYSFSDSSEGLFQRGKGDDRIHDFFRLGEKKCS